MYRISIIDDFCPRPYGDRSLSSEPMGGTELATVLLAEALAVEADVSVEVIQHNRLDERVSLNGVWYRGSENWRTTAQRSTADRIIIINSPKLLSIFARHAPCKKLVLWRHNFLGNRHRRMHELLESTGASLVCVSHHHYMHTLAHLGLSDAASNQTRIGWIPNPVQVYRPSNSVVDPNKLLFCSSPHKGFDIVLSRFRSLRRLRPKLKLYVCNPGYLPDTECRDAGVVVIGALDRPTLHRHMASSLCLFYPQTRFRETFGLVAAEANALLTPVLGPANFGALPDTVSPANPLLTSLDTQSIVRLIDQWQQGLRPVIQGNPEFDPKSVCCHWVKLLGLPAKPGPSSNSISAQTAGAISSSHPKDFA